MNKKCLACVKTFISKLSIFYCVYRGVSLHFSKIQKPTCWSHLPDHIWMKVLNYLPMRSVNNVHLISRNFHRIANLHVNPILRFDKRSTVNSLKSLFESSRVFEKLQFGESHFPPHLSNFKLIDCSEETGEKYISFLRPSIKKLSVGFLTLAPKILMDLVKSLPNLESIEFKSVKEQPEAEAVTWDFQLKKVKCVEIYGDSPNCEKLLGTLSECVVQEATLQHYGHEPNPLTLEITRGFLKQQQKNLKKLRIVGSVDLLSDLEQLQLEELTIDGSNYSLAFLKKQKKLKSLKLYESVVTSENSILELKTLEVLTLFDCWYENDGFLDNLFKLVNLKELNFSSFLGDGEIILDRMRFGTFNKLEELSADFQGVSVESIRDLNRFAPNLKKINLYSGSSEVINAMLENLGKLESLQSWVDSIEWKLTEEQNFTCPNIKSLHYLEYFPCDTLEHFTKMFPNVEELQFGYWPEKFDIHETIRIILQQMKQLKKLGLSQVVKNVAPETDAILQCLLDNGSKVEDLSLNHPYVHIPEIPTKVEAGYEIWEEPGTYRRFKKIK